MEKLIETHGFRKMLFEDERTQLEKLYTLQAQCQGSALERLNGMSDVVLAKTMDHFSLIVTGNHLVIYRDF